MSKPRFGEDLLSFFRQDELCLLFILAQQLLKNEDLIEAIDDELDLNEYGADVLAELKAKLDMYMKDDKPTVVISVSGGVADIIERPDDVRVIIRDYDVDGAEEENLSKDPDGEDCREWIEE